MQRRIKHNIFILLIIICQENALVAQDSIHIDTISIREITIHHSSPKGEGHVLIPTDETMVLYEWVKKEGFNMVYRPDGTKYLEGWYKQKNDTTFVSNGYFKFYNLNSTISKEGKYKIGKLVGQWKYYDTIGNLDYITDYEIKRKIFYYSNGTKKAEGKYKIAKPVGSEFRVKKWKFYYSNGNLKCEGVLTLFGKVGKWDFYNDKGEIIDQKFYSRQFFRFYKSVNIESNYENVCNCK